MKRVSKGELEAAIEERKPGERLAFNKREIWNMDLTGRNLGEIDFVGSSFQNIILDGANFENSNVENTLFDGCSLHGVNFKGADLKTASFRYCDLREGNLEDADLFGAVLEHARLEGVITNEATKWFRLHCPEKGAFIGYKKCVNDRIVQLLIPADAKRTSATLPSCRCNKAKVLTIKSFDLKENFEEAWSLVDENFVYRKGQWVEVTDFNEDRWQDSATGIHFWMTRKEAENY